MSHLYIFSKPNISSSIGIKIGIENHNFKGKSLNNNEIIEIYANLFYAILLPIHSFFTKNRGFFVFIDLSQIKRYTSIDL
ncbi:hypothetical protein PNEG_04280 [Pneumocystis murina B123]|uniref:Uncharacterized protein n=1 Tax=Pneumocystis murina (strain B123) TaxID=1069680 RepID=A0A0W4ZX10_PNEMU|nr:hypothetical protein PNEG_04280 [Pneumocystis murina B123]KTW32911.1 hypothetical protein PNEG_04280 [Pneumocystis murina B123]